MIQHSCGRKLQSFNSPNFEISVSLLRCPTAAALNRSPQSLRITRDPALLMNDLPARIQHRMRFECMNSPESICSKLNPSSAAIFLTSESLPRSSLQAPFEMHGASILAQRR